MKKQIYEVLINTPDAEGNHFQRNIVKADNIEEALKVSDDLMIKNYADTVAYYTEEIRLRNDILFIG